MMQPTVHEHDEAVEADCRGTRGTGVPHSTASAKAGHVRRVRAVLLAADGVSGVEIGRRLGFRAANLANS
jgi:hypothetical protein